MTVLFSLAGWYKKPYLKFPNTIQTFIQGVINCFLIYVSPTPPHTVNLTIQVSYFVNMDNKQCVEVQVYVGCFLDFGEVTCYKTKSTTMINTKEWDNPLCPKSSVYSVS